MRKKLKCAICLSGHVRGGFYDCFLYKFIFTVSRIYDIDIYIHTCRVRWLYIPADAPTRARDGDGRIVGARKSHARVHARRCSRMRAHTHLLRKYSYASTYIHKTYAHIYIYIYIYNYTYIHIMRAIARTCACEAVQPHARPYLSLAQVFIYLYIYVCIFTMHAYIYIQI